MSNKLISNKLTKEEFELKKQEWDRTSSEIKNLTLQIEKLDGDINQFMKRIESNKSRKANIDRFLDTCQSNKETLIDLIEKKNNLDNERAKLIVDFDGITMILLQNKNYLME